MIALWCDCVVLVKTTQCRRCNPYHCVALTHTREQLLMKSFHNHQQPPPPVSDQRNQQTPANPSTTVSRYLAKAMASKDETTDSQPTDLDTAESYLLKLAPELRNRIFELVLSAAPKCYISELTRPHKPGPLNSTDRFAPK
jgi:hypothetical protein